MGTATVCRSKKVLTVDRAGYYEIRGTVKQDCGSMAELAATEAMDNALRHGKHAKATVIDAGDSLELIVENDSLACEHSRMENGGMGIKIIESLVETGEVSAFKHAVKDGVHRAVIKFPKCEAAPKA